MKAVVVLLCSLAFVGCVSEPVEKVPPNDAEIFQARSLVADYNARMDKVNLYIKECTKEEIARPGREQEKSVLLLACASTAYDMYGFYQRENGRISNGELEMFKNNTAIALMPTSTGD